MWSAVAAAAEIRAGRRSSVALVEEALRLIEAENHGIGAVVELRAAAALHEAAAVDRGEQTGPLAGVPITIKEAIHVAGMRSTWGIQDARDHRAEKDAAIVARLRGAGAIVVATTNVQQMLADFTRTENPLYGRTSNPRASGRRPGGSSGGSAAAVAAGFSYLDVGSDLVGSVRIPAAFCGVFGLRPTAGSVSLEGFGPPGAPPAPRELTYLSTLGPLARTAEDLAAAVKVIADSAPGESREGELRARVVLDDPAVPTDPEVRDVLSTAAAAFGDSVVSGWPEWADPERDQTIFGAHLEAFFAGATGQQPAVDQHDPARQQAIQRWQRTFAEVDVVLCPVFPTAPPEYDADIPGYEQQACWITYAALCGLPAASVPVGQTADGLPVGIQIIGPPGGDLTVVRAAERFHPAAS